jgi:hypothetical protein
MSSATPMVRFGEREDAVKTVGDALEQGFTVLQTFWEPISDVDPNSAVADLRRYASERDLSLEALSRMPVVQAFHSSTLTGAVAIRPSHSNHEPETRHLIWGIDPTIANAGP